MSRFTLGRAVTVAVCVLASACGGSEVGSGGAAGAAGSTFSGAGAGGANDNLAGGSAGGASGGQSLGGANSAGASSAGASSAGANSAGAGGAVVQACEAIAPCGGDLVGTWQVQKYCSPTAQPSANSSGLCAGSSIEISPAMLTGTITFNADKTMSSAVALTFDESAKFPPSCYTEAQCADFATSLASEANVTDAKCSYAAASGCSCSLHYGGPQTSSGTYEVSGNRVTISNGNSTKPEVDEFCVSGNTASVQSTAAARSTMILAKIP